MNFEDYETLPTNNVVTHMTAGAIAGIMEHCVMYPLDSVKTRMQSLSTSGRQGISETFLRMIKHEGILRPVRGMTAMVVGAGPSHALYFSSYEYFKDTMIQHTTTSRYYPLIYGASGCISTLLHDGIMNPAEVVKQRMQMLNSPYKSAVECCINVYKNEGIRAFYRSYTTQLTMNIPFQSIHFMIYEFAQKITNKEGTYNPPAHMLSGAIAGAVASAITTPLDVCKTLLNTQPVGLTTGLTEAFKKVYKLGGIKGYFRGIQARIMYQMPATAICWSTYEFFKYILGEKTHHITSSTTSVLNETADLPKINEQSTNQPTNSNTASDKLNIKPIELPAMSGSGLYGTISFNTMHHTADPSFNNTRRKDSIHNNVVHM